jgi:hypothetical protein
MITPRTKPSAFFARQPSADLFVQEQRQNKLGTYVANLAAMDGLIDFRANEAQAFMLHTPDKRAFNAAGLGLAEGVLDDLRSSFWRTLRAETEVTLSGPATQAPR